MNQGQESEVTAVNRSRNVRAFPRRTRRILPAVAAVGSVCGFAASQAVAIELGELRMESTLGQPLRASISYALGPNETLYDFCIALRAPQAGGPIPSVTRANVSVTGNSIILTGNTAVKDPLLNLRVAIDCPYTPHLVREYTMIIDPVLPAETQTVQVADTTTTATPAVTSAPATATVRATSAPTTEEQSGAAESRLTMNTEYRVLNGDTISVIASRVEGRTLGIRDAVTNLIAANPDAFIGGNANQLVSGSVLFIPDLTEAVAQTPDSAVPDVAEPVAELESNLAGEMNAFFEPAPAVPEAAEQISSQPSIAEPLKLPVAETAEPVPESLIPQDEPPVLETAVAELPEAPIESEPVAEIVAVPEPVEDAVTEFDAASAPVETAVTEPELQPGDVVVAAPAESVNQPAAPVVRSSSIEPTGDSNWSLILLLAAAGATLLLVGGVFWGRFRDLFGSRAVNEPAAQPEAPVEEETVTSTIIDDVDFEFNDAVSADEISLDADLDAGTGLRESGEVDVAQDFNFNSVSETDNQVDMELPDEIPPEPEKHGTDIIPPSHKIEESSILEAEVEPSDEEYDMSMIVDATKQRIGDDDLTAQDLRAVPVGGDGSNDEYAVEDGTLATAMDLEILEQDYQDEFTQTQALSQQMDEAAAELAATLEAQEKPATEPAATPQSVTEVDFELEPTAEMQSNVTEVDLDLTSEMPATDQDTGLAPTVEMPARQADPGLEPTVEMSMTEDDSGTHPELTASIPVDADALNDELGGPDITSKLAAAGSDVTVEMEVESGSVDTKKDDS